MLVILCVLYIFKNHEYKIPIFNVTGRFQIGYAPIPQLRQILSIAF